eukprot:scaffold89164_cov20-Tisochrysis_lutea.AAC.2
MVDAWIGAEGGAVGETGATATAAAAHSVSAAPRNEVSDVGYHAGDGQLLSGGTGAEACVALPARESPQHAQQQGQVLLGLAADSVLRVGVTNHSSTACFEVQLSREAAELGKGEGGEVSGGSREGATVEDKLGLQGSRWPWYHGGQWGREVGLGRCSPPVVLQPGESTSLLAYLNSTIPADCHDTRAPLVATACSKGMATTSSRGSLHSTCQNGGALSEHTGSPMACDSTSSVACKWEPSGGCTEVAAAAASAAWVVVWRQVDAPGARGPASAAGAAGAGQGAVLDAPCGVCWLTATDLAKAYCALALLDGAEERCEPCRSGHRAVVPGAEQSKLPE